MKKFKSFDFNQLKLSVKSAVAPTIMATLIFFLTYFLFGAENSMIGPFATLSFLRYRTMRNHYECMIKNYAIFLAMAVLAFFAVQNLPLCVLINALALFWIAYILIDEYNPTNYFPAGMALIFFQITPVTTLPALGNRIAALASTFVLVLLFTFVLTQITGEKNPLPQILQRGFTNCARQLMLCRALADNDDHGPEQVLANDDHGLEQALANDEIHSLEQALSGDCDTGAERTTANNSNTHANRTPAYNNTADCSDRKAVRAAAAEELDRLHEELCEINKKASAEIYAYNRASLFPRGKSNWYCRFILFFQILNYLTLNHQTAGNLERAESLYRDFSHQFETVTPTADYHRLNFRLKKPDIRSFRLRFALRQVITLTPCLAFAFYSDLPNIYWIVISVFFMMIPFTDHTMKRVRDRVAGTIAGIVICLVLFSVFRGFGARVIIMTIANFMIYGANGYGPTVAYITCSALAISTIDAAITAVLARRLLYTLIGAGIALIANKWIFPIRLRYQIEYLAEMIRSIRGDLVKLDPSESFTNGKQRWKIDQMIIKTYLLSKRLEGMCESLPEKDRHFNYQQFQKKHMNIMAEFLTKHFLPKP